MSFIIAIINLAIAVALFFGVAQPAVDMPLTPGVDENKNEVFHGGINVLKVKRDELNQAITAASKLSDQVSQLTEKYNQFSEEDHVRLDRFLPRHIDNIRLIIDVGNIAARNNLQIKNVEFKNVASNETSVVAATTSENGVNSMALAFVIAAPYDKFQAFLKDLSKSMRIVDITASAFDSNEKDLYQYQVTIRTYWVE